MKTQINPNQFSRTKKIPARDEEILLEGEEAEEFKRLAQEDGISVSELQRKAAWSHVNRTNRNETE